LRRAIHLIPILLGISVVVFTLVELAPGDPVDALIPPGTIGVSEDVRERVREEFGLNEPAPIRYFHWLERAVVGDFGYSLSSNQPISDIILGRLPATLQLVGFALVMSIVLGVLTGVISAIKQYS